MAKLLYGSICIDTLFNGKIQTGQNGKRYVCIDDLSDHPFLKSESNGKSYVGVTVWVNDTPDNYGNDASIQLSQKKEDRQAKVKPQYIGKLKKNLPVDRTQQQTTSTIISGSGLPF